MRQLSALTYLICLRSVKFSIYLDISYLFVLYNYNYLLCSFYDLHILFKSDLIPRYIATYLSLQRNLIKSIDNQLSRYCKIIIALVLKLIRHYMGHHIAR